MRILDTDFGDIYAVEGAKTAVEPLTSRPYVALTNGGVKKEGEVFPFFHKTKEAAIRGYVHFLRCCLDLTGCDMIIWREKPFVEQHDGKWTVYSRLVLTNQEKYRAVA